MYRRFHMYLNRRRSSLLHRRVRIYYVYRARIGPQVSGGEGEGKDLRMTVYSGIGRRTDKG